MRNVVLKLPTLGFVVATRAALGVGLGLLLSQQMSEGRRKRVGMALVALGAAATVPAAMAVFRGVAAGSRQ